ncbi:uncharacterized protein N7515_002370 [Penicillium bovifimosum]|uniref:Uncharacterized protein n=1 Tax=Penicillium bovifimosum TaxID=126998 RepID=A0A9W9L965_9EURO|nr:uncharacterized protein N7515_002370 [Penicillium bovifimosum]KAJ5143583.1 hypothetical protein N7515_002370 [Penicillium bovifimosum]
MTFPNSFKSGPLGIVDTRISMDEMKDSNMDIASLPDFAPLTGLDGSDETQPGSQTEAEASSNRAYRLLDYRKSFLDVSSSRKDPRLKLNVPRLELDVAADKYHTLDGLIEPLNPQNTPASDSGGSVKESSEMLRCHKTSNARTGTESQSEEFNYDCFHDSPEASCDLQTAESQWPGSLNLLRFSTRRSQSFDLPAPGRANHPPTTDPCMLKEPDNQDSRLRSVRFAPPVATPIPPSSAMNRHLLPDGDIQGDAASKRRQKQSLNLLSGGPNFPRCTCADFGHTPDHDEKCRSSFTRQDREGQFRNYMEFQFRPCQCVCNRTPHTLRDHAVSELPDCEVYHGVSRDSPIVGADNVTDTLLTNDSDVAKDAKRLPDFVLISLSLHRVRRVPDSPLGSGSTYDLRLRIVQIFPQVCSRKLSLLFDYIPRHTVVDNLLFNICFVIPGLVVLLYTTFIIFAASPWANTSAGAVLLRFGKALLRLWKKIVNRVFAKLGVSFGFQCTSEINNLE